MFENRILKQQRANNNNTGETSRFLLPQHLTVSELCKHTFAVCELCLLCECFLFEQKKQTKWYLQSLRSHTWSSRWEFPVLNINKDDLDHLVFVSKFLLSTRIFLDRSISHGKSITIYLSECFTKSAVVVRSAKIYPKNAQKYTTF